MHEVNVTKLQRLYAGYSWNADETLRTFTVMDDGLNVGGLDEIVTLDDASSHVNATPYVMVSESGLYAIQVSSLPNPAGGSDEWYTLSLSFDESWLLPNATARYINNQNPPKMYISAIDRIPAGSGFNINYSWSTAPSNFGVDMVMIKLA